MKTSVRANRHIASGDLTENENFWNNYDRSLRRQRVHLEKPSRRGGNVIVYSATRYSGASKTAAWASIIEWPDQVELVHGAINVPLENLGLLTAFRTLSCIGGSHHIIYYAEFAYVVAKKLKECPNASSPVSRNDGWQMLRNLVEKRTIEWRFDINKRPRITFCRRVVAADLKFSWSLHYGS